MIEIWLILFLDFLANNIVAVVSIVVTIATPVTIVLLKSRSKRRNILRKHFKFIWEKSSALHPKDLLELRPYDPVYHQRDEDGQIRRALLARSNVLVLGSPLSGKTRAVYEALTNLNKACDVLIARTVDIDLEKFLFPRHLKFWRPKVLVVDDLHRFVEQQNFEHLLRMADEKSTTVMATCRSGFECRKAKSKMAEKGMDFESVFGDTVFELGKVSPEEAQKVAKKAGIEWENVEFDGTVGSVFMPLSEMEKRFNECDDVQKTILRTLRNLYMCGVYEENQVFPLAWVKIASKKTGLKAEDYEWNGWLEVLRNREFIVLRKDAVQVEEIYLEKIVRPEAQISHLHLLRDMLSAFSGVAEALLRLGNLASSVGEFHLERADYMKLAIQTFHEALKVYTVDRFPMDYGITQNSLGIAYRILAEVESKAQNCRLAIKAHEEALKVRPLDRFPMYYGMTQNNLGTAYGTLATVEAKADNCKRATKAYEEALKHYVRERFPRQYAGIHMNLGNTYRKLAEVEAQADNGQTAIKNMAEALSIYTPEHFPIEYAKTQLNLAIAHNVLADVKLKATNCKEAISHCAEALRVFTFDLFPIDYAMTQTTLGIAYGQLAEEEGRAWYCNRAIEAFQEALRVNTLASFPMDYGLTQNNLGNVYHTLAEEEAKGENCKRAIKAYEEALNVRTPDRLPIQYGITQNNLGNAYLTLAEVESKAENCRLAIGAHEEALKVYTLDRFPMDYGMTQNNLGNAYWTLAEEEAKADNCAKAAAAFQEALKVFRKDELPQDYQMVQDNLRNLAEFCNRE